MKNYFITNHKVQLGNGLIERYGMQEQTVEHNLNIYGMHGNGNRNSRMV